MSWRTSTLVVRNQAGVTSMKKLIYAHLCIEHKSSLINRVVGGI